MTEENLTPYIPIGTLFKYLLKDYRRERQRTIHMEAQVRSLLKRNAYLEQEIGKVKQRLLKIGEIGRASCRERVFLRV